MEIVYVVRSRPALPRLRVRLCVIQLGPLGLVICWVLAWSGGVCPEFVVSVVRLLYDYQLPLNGDKAPGPKMPPSRNFPASPLVRVVFRVSKLLKGKHL